MHVITEFMKPLFEDFVSTAKDINSAHVVRSALCLLAGLPVVSERRGKTSKHKHSVGLSEPLDTLLLPPDGFHIDSSCCFSVPDTFHELIGTVVIEKLLSLRLQDLQTLVVDIYGATVISFTLRVLFSSGIIDGGPELAERLSRVILDWEEGQSNDNGPTVFYAMAGERSGSYFIETLLQCCGKQMFLDIAERAVQTRCVEYVEHNSANFVLQTVLRRLVSLLADVTKENRVFGDRIHKLVRFCYFYHFIFVCLFILF